MRILWLGLEVLVDGMLACAMAFVVQFRSALLPHLDAEGDISEPHQKLFICNIHMHFTALYDCTD